MIKQMTLFKKILVGLILSVLIFIVGIIVWINLPAEEVNLSQLLPADAFMLASVRLFPSESAKCLSLITYFAQGNKLLNSRFGFLNNFAVKLLLPSEIIVAASLNNDSEKPDYLFLVKNKKLSRIARLVKLLSFKQKAEKKSNYIIFKDAVLISKNHSLTKTAIENYGSQPTLALPDRLEDFSKLREQHSIIIFVKNRDLKFSRLIKRIEKKSSYPIFPTVDMMGEIVGYFDLAQAGLLEGSLRFQYAGKMVIKEAKEDVVFLVGFMRRFFKAEGLNCSSKMEVKDNFINLEILIS